MVLQRKGVSERGLNLSRKILIEYQITQQELNGYCSLDFLCYNNKVDLEFLPTMTTNPQKPNGCLIGCGSLIFLFVVIGLIGSLTTTLETAKTPEQKKQEQEQKLNEWYKETSPYSCERSLKETLRNPNSYERSGDFVTASDNGNKKVVIWKFRAENGFGGMNVAGAMCSIYKKNGGEYQVRQITE